MSTRRTPASGDELVALPSKVHASVRHAVDAYCNATNESRSEVVEKALVQFLAQPQATATVLNNSQQMLASYGQSVSYLSDSIGSITSSYSDTVKRLGGGTSDAPLSS